MRSMEVIIDGINPTNFVTWNGAKISAYITVVGETIRVRIELPPLARSLTERLREEFVKLVPKLTE